MKPFLATLVILLGLLSRTDAGPLPTIRVHVEGHYLETDDGRPFFWLGDTAWELIHRATRDECTYYLRTRSRQGFNVIQTVVLSEFDGLNQPTAIGDRPFIDNDPGKPNSAYFERVREIVDEAASVGLYVALVPAWGDKLTAPWGQGPRLFTNERLPVAREYGRYLGNLLRGRTNVIWLLGGDRPARLRGMSNDSLQQSAHAAGFPPDQDWTPIWREMAAGLAEGADHRSLVVYHPQGGEQSSSFFLHMESWLDVNGLQSGHGGGHDQPVWKWIARDFALVPAKPTLDLEPNYEDCPFNPWPRWDPAKGYFRDYDVRKQCYRSVFAGGCGVTYGHHAVWQWAGARQEPLLYVDRGWVDAMHRPAGRQLIFLRQLVESRPFFNRIPDQTIVTNASPDGAQQIIASRDRDGSYAFLYFPNSDQSATVDLGALRVQTIRASWYDPRTGFAHPIGQFEGGKPQNFTSPPYGPDWVLVLDDLKAGYSQPGQQ